MNALRMAKLVEAQVLLSAAANVVAHATAGATVAGAFDESELATLRALHVAVLECGAMVRGRMVACEEPPPLPRRSHAAPTPPPARHTDITTPAPLTKRPVRPYDAEDALGVTVDTTA